MTIGLVMNVRDSADTIKATLESVRDLVDHWTIVDTGSTDDTPELVAELMAGIPGELHHEEWVGFAHNRTLAAEHARGTADWLLWLDDDMTVTWHEGLKAFLAEDPCPDVDAWLVEIIYGDMLLSLQLLFRGHLDWRFVGVIHEHLDMTGRQDRRLLGLTVTQGPGRRDLERDLELLRPGFYSRVPRDTFYYAETLRHLGRTKEAAIAYRIRGDLGDWEEEAWYARYQAARLAGDIPALLAAHAERPWRHEPLTAAARVAAAGGSRDDVLFLERAP